MTKNFVLQCFRDLTFVSRDSLGVVVEQLLQIAADKYQKLTDVTRGQLVWVTKYVINSNLFNALIVWGVSINVVFIYVCA